MNNGLHGAIYPEGTRGQDDGTYTEQEQTQKRDVTKLLPLHPGIGRIACGLERPENVSIVCIGTVFGPNHDDARHPTSYVAMPFPVANSVEGVVSETEATLQGALDAAVEIANR
jgi:1-acyl-sn-glycerol-3-phosphate acyltransferase